MFHDRIINELEDATALTGVKKKPYFQRMKTKLAAVKAIANPVKSDLLLANGRRGGFLESDKAMDMMDDRAEDMYMR